jgi:hypothetical protein
MSPSFGYGWEEAQIWAWSTIGRQSPLTNRKRKGIVLAARITSGRKEAGVLTFTAR